VTKPNPENCKNCTSKCAYVYAQLQYAIQNRTVLIISLLPPDKILGVTITNGLSVSPHVQSVIVSCAQVLYALRVLRAHGLCDSALQTIYHSVVIA